MSRRPSMIFVDELEDLPALDTNVVSTSSGCDTPPSPLSILSIDSNNHHYHSSLSLDHAVSSVTSTVSSVTTPASTRLTLPSFMKTPMQPITPFWTGNQVPQKGPTSNSSKNTNNEEVTTPKGLSTPKGPMTPLKEIKETNENENVMETVGIDAKLTEISEENANPNAMTAKQSKTVSVSQGVRTKRANSAKTTTKSPKKTVKNGKKGSKTPRIVKSPRKSGKTPRNSGAVSVRSVRERKNSYESDYKAKIAAKMQLHYKLKDARERTFLVIADESKLIYKKPFLLYFKHFILNNNNNCNEWNELNKTKFNKLSDKEQEKVVYKFFSYLSNNKDILSFSMFVKRVNDDGNIMQAFLNWLQTGSSR